MTFGGLKSMWVIVLFDLPTSTKKERKQPAILNGSRRKRIAFGSGTSLADINQLVKQFNMMNKMLKQMGNMKNMGDLSGMFKNNRM